MGLPWPDGTRLCEPQYRRRQGKGEVKFSFRNNYWRRRNTVRAPTSKQNGLENLTSNLVCRTIPFTEGNSNVRQIFKQQPAKDWRRALRLLPLLPFLTGTGSVLAQTAPAVSELNGKVDYAGGIMDSSEGNNFDASITLPVTHQFGFQADTLYSHIGDSDFYGGGGHFFWRNPNIGLIGLTGGYLYCTGVDTFQAGVEGEYYLGPFTLGFFGGVGQINYAYAEPFIDTNPTRFIGRLSADYYPLDDLRVGVSYTTAFANSLGAGDLEYQTPIRGLALTAEAAIGDHGYDHLLFGVRYYFGSQKSLRDRQRQDDPPGIMQQVLHSLGLYGAEFDQKGNAYLQAHGESASYSEYGTIMIEAERQAQGGTAPGGTPGQGLLPPTTLSPSPP